jgi:HK97 family phage prohead protease
MPEPKTDKGKQESRSLPMTQAELRIEGGDDDKKIVGYASVFYDGTEGTEYALWEDMKERIMPGTFDDALSNPDDVRGLFNHDPNQILGRTAAGTLTLSVDTKGLFYEIEPGDTTTARDVIESIRRGDVDGSSFAFRVLDEELKKEDGKYVREITRVGLYDVGPVTYPAYAAATSGYRKEEAVAAEVRALVDTNSEVTTVVDTPPESAPVAKPDPPEEDEESRALKQWAAGLTVDAE